MLLMDKKLSKGAGGDLSSKPTDILVPQWNNQAEQDAANSNM